MSAELELSQSGSQTVSNNHQKSLALRYWEIIVRRSWAHSRLLTRIATESGSSCAPMKNSLYNRRFVLKRAVGDLPDWICSASRRTPTLLTCKKRSPNSVRERVEKRNFSTPFESHDGQPNTITGLCERPPKNPYYGTESNFVAILQLSVRDRNVIDLRPVC